MVVNRMMILYISGAYSTPLNVNLARHASSLACAEAVSDLPRKMHIHHVVLLSTGLSVSFPGLTETLTLCFERRLVDLTILFDDIDGLAITID